MERRIFAQGSIREYEHDGDDKDGQYLPGRSLAFAISHPESIFFLPDHPQVTRYHEQLDEIRHDLGRSRMNGNAVFIPDTHYLLDIAIAEHIPVVAEQLNRNEHYMVYPYAVTQDTTQWISELQQRGFRLSASLPQRVYYEDLRDTSHRGGWGRHVSTPDEPSFAEFAGIAYPTSYTGQGRSEIVEAYQRVAQESIRAFFKPVFSAGGFTLKEVTNVAEVIEQHYQLKKMGALDILGQETPVEIQAYIPDIKGVYSLQYQDDKIITPGGITEQMMNGNKWVGNIFNENANPELVRQAAIIFDRYRTALTLQGKKLHGQGGFDFAEIKTQAGKSQLMMIEHNGLRMTGANPAIALAEGFGVQGVHMAQKSPGEVQCDVATLWDVLKSNGLQFDPATRVGIFPIVWMEGSGMLWGAGHNVNSIKTSMDYVYNVLDKLGYISS